MIAADLRKKTIEDLEKLAKKTKQEVAEMRLEVIKEKESNVTKIRDLRKDYARILTVLNEKRRNNNA
ncbi:50S ribosomal protein L29 [candidate division WWE3 bacterium]|nr:50S ribosomal protein L29 [candidate division WWE3 bacterium]